MRSRTNGRSGHRSAGPRLRSLLLVAFVLSGCAASPSPVPTGDAASGPNATAPGTSTPDATTAAEPGGEQPTPGVPDPGIASEPTSADRILAALAAGTIDEPTALLYRVYATFGDPRLPAEYASADREEDASALAQAALRLESLPAEIAAELRPYLARPTDPISVFHGTGATGMRPPTAVLAMARPGAIQEPVTAAAVTCDTATNWGYIDGADPWRVWGRCNGPSDPQLIEEAALMVADLWGRETALMGPPVPDSGGPAEAGDGRIDIYLVNQCVSRAGRCLWSAGISDALGAAPLAPGSGGSPGARTSSAFILISGAAFGTNLKSVIAHELFHVLEFAHNVDGLLNGPGGWHWFTEASAKWSESYFVPLTRRTNVHPWFATYQSSAYGLQDTAGANEYASYLWPFFMEQERGPAAIQSAWVAIDGKTTHAAITSAIGAQLPFSSRFREFAVRAWNAPLSPRDPISPRFQKLDPGLPQSTPAGERWKVWDTLQGNPATTPPRDMPTTMPSLSARYTRFEVANSVHQIILDFSTLDPPTDVDVDVLLRIKDKGWERRKLPVARTKLCTDKPDDDVTSLIVVLSNHDADPDDTVAGKWTVQSLEEPCMGWDVKIVWTDVYDSVQDTVTFQGVVDTIEQGASDVGTFMTGTGTASGSRAGWKGCNPGIEVAPSGTGSATFVAQVIGDEVTIAGFADLQSVLAGVNTMPFTVPIKGGKAEIKPTPLIGDLCPRTSFGSIEVTPADAP